MPSHLRKTTIAAVAVTLLTSACTSESAVAPPATETGTDGVTEISSEGAAENPPAEEVPDLANGFEVYTLADRSLWATPVPYSEGCDGLPAYRLWSVPDDSTARAFVGSSIPFIGVPIIHDTPHEGVVTIDQCNGNYTVHFAQLTRFGSLENAIELTPGDVNAAVDVVYYDAEAGSVVFQLDDSATEPTLVWVYPPTGEVDRSVELGEPTAGCSASGMSPAVGGDDQLPTAVAIKRNAIIDAAIACDFAALESLTGPEFVFQHELVDPGPAYSWALQEQVFGEPMLETLVLLLQQSATAGDNGEGGTWYGWPEAYVLSQDNFTAATRDQLVTIGLTPEHADRIMTGEADYIWYRTGMDADGTWRFFIAGD